MLNVKKRIKEVKQKEIKEAVYERKLNLEQFENYYYGLDDELNVYLSEQKDIGRFCIKYRLNGEAKRIDIKYNACGRDEGLRKAHDKVEQIKRDYRVNFINKVS